MYCGRVDAMSTGYKVETDPGPNGCAENPPQIDPSKCPESGDPKTPDPGVQESPDKTS